MPKPFQTPKESCRPAQHQLSGDRMVAGHILLTQGSWARPPDFPAVVERAECWRPHRPIATWLAWALNLDDRRLLNRSDISNVLYDSHANARNGSGGMHRPA
ncbi:hypothetical protein RISK_001659 [Rhodopirellula islandica]|uniref:Uncharacterized protein n=1 Tax=Rhodopirellula islandica TaxID=595434 RepID=A0A0J1BJ37_RHOIS|nr:hypothetical protein RISK_001659 [Rhodopirellula islandica]